MGFCFDPSSPDFLLPIKAKEIIEWTSGSHAVGEFGDQSIEEILAMSELLNMDVVALNNHLLPDELPQIQKPIIKMVNLDKMGPVELANELCAYAPYTDAFQLNGSQNILGREDELKEACLQYKIIWNLPFTSKNMMEIIGQYQPYALNLAAGSEESVGMKDYDELNEILEILGGETA
jgi:phosphoribosylanthranilate isomerase